MVYYEVLGWTFVTDWVCFWLLVGVEMDSNPLGTWAGSDARETATYVAFCFCWVVAKDSAILSLSKELQISFGFKSVQISSSSFSTRASKSSSLCWRSVRLVDSDPATEVVSCLGRDCLVAVSVRAGDSGEGDLDDSGMNKGWGFVGWSWDVFGGASEMWTVVVTAL